MRIQVPASAKTVLFAACAALALSSFASAQAAKTDEAAPTLWQIVLKKGDISRYRVQLTLTGQSASGTPFTIETRSVNRDEVKKTTEAGDATLQTIIEENSLLLEGQPVKDDPASRPLVTRTFSKEGLLLSYNIVNAPPGMEQLNTIRALLTNQPVPPKPVKIGESWKTEVENLLVKGKKITLTSTLVGTEKVLDTDSLKIRFELTFPTTAEPGAKDPIKASGVYNLDPRTGRLLQAEDTAENLELTGPDGSIRLKLVQKLSLLVSSIK